jgi:DDE family transposase
VTTAVCTRTGLPLAWETRTARDAEVNFAIPLMDAVIGRGFSPSTVSMDKGYDAERIHTACEARGVHPVIPIREGGVQPRCPSCQHGDWTFAGSDAKRGASKWRCPTGECQPASMWIKASRLQPLIPRHTKRWRDLRAGRAAVEREFGNLKHNHGLATLRVRGLDRVRLHVDLTMLARLAVALARARAVPLAA